MEQKNDHTSQPLSRDHSVSLSLLLMMLRCNFTPEDTKEESDLEQTVQANL